jgi:hypothetical protein
VYNLSDLAGKSLPSRLVLLSPRTLPWAAACHTAFVPLFLCLARPEWAPPILRSDGAAIGLVAALGMCTGYIGCTALILGAEKGRTPDEREALGMVTSFCLMLGLSSGSATGLLLSQWVLG